MYIIIIYIVYNKISSKMPTDIIG